MSATVLATAMIFGLSFGCMAVAAAPDRPTSQAPQPRVIRVATKPLVPFVEFEGKEQRGFSVDLWDEVAERNGWRTTWVRTATVDELLATVTAGDADAGIAGVSVTADREQTLDFSHPMFDSGLQIMVNADRDNSMWSQVRNVVDASVLKFVLGMILAITLGGHVVWLFQRRDGRAPPDYLAGVGYGMWVTGATALAGDVDPPRRWVGRVVALAWIVVGVLAIAVFTATVTTRLTVNSIRSDIGSFADLPGKRIVTVKGTTSDLYLERASLEYQVVASIEDAYTKLRTDKVDAIVYDAPILRHHANTPIGSGQLVVGPVFNNESYGIALPDGSKLREQINRTLLAIRGDGTYDRLYQRWFGNESAS
jgi:polar amino acid transport system substrate-binding protein